jgi:hypothetical protein
MLGERFFFPASVIERPDAISQGLTPEPWDRWFFLIVLVLFVLWLMHSQAFASTVTIPGADASDKLEAAGTLLRIVDSVLFSWGARIFAGLCVMSAGWNLKEQRFGIAVLCVVAAIVLGTAPMWVRNIFDIGGGGGIFSYLLPHQGGIQVA